LNKSRGSSNLFLERASASRFSGQWGEDDFDVLEDGVVVGRIFVVPTGPEGRLIARAAHGYEPTREAAMAAFAKRWLRE
jgi:hypothetical protein